MKYAKILSIVACLHLFLLSFLIVTPGCKTTPADDPSITQTDGSGTVEPTTLTPTGATRISGSQPTQAGYANTVQRYEPTRPIETMEAAPVESAAFDPGDVLRPVEQKRVTTTQGSPTTSSGSASTGSSTGTRSSTTTTTTASSSPTVHTVQKGDSLWKISRNYGVTISALAEANGISKDAVIKVGQELTIPGTGSTASASTSGDVDMSTMGRDYEPGELLQTSRNSLNAILNRSSDKNYTVKSGDNLYKIARNHGVTVQAIRDANNLKSDVLQIGQLLTIPADEETSSAGNGPQSSYRKANTTPGYSGVHVVKSGEFPGKIAAMYDMSVTELMKVNGISNPRALKVNQELAVKGSGDDRGGAVPEDDVFTIPDGSGSGEREAEINAEDYFRNFEDEESAPLNVVGG